nr:DUF2142 domain-containing protein [Micromonospora sp. DSM 115978]
MLRPGSVGQPSAASTQGPVGAIRRAWQAVPAAVWLILVLHLLVVLCQTAIFPNFRSPDERHHVDLIVMVERGEAWPWPDQGTLPMSLGGAAGGFTISGGLPGRLRLAEENPPPRAERRSYLEAGGTAADDELPRNQLIQHPPLYYLAGAAVVALIPGWENLPFDRVFLVLRWWNVLFAVVLPLALWAIARRLRLPDPVPVAAALVPLAIPELTHNQSSVNNDNLLIATFALLTLLMVRVLTGDTSRRTALGVGLLATVALLTKGFALLIPVWIGLVYLAAAIRFRRRAALTGLVIAGAAAIPGLAWWIRNKLVYGSLQPHGRFTENPTLTAQYGWSDGGMSWLLRLIERMNTLFFVHDQTGDRLRHGPWWMAVAAATLVLVGVVVTIAWRVLPRTTTVVVLVPVCAILAIVAKGSWEQYADSQLYAGMQGRYLYGGLAGLGVVAVAATAKLPGRARRWFPLALFGFAAAMHAVYLWYTLWLFWAPRGAGRAESMRRSVEAIVEWYAFPPLVLALVALGTATAAVATAVALVRVARSGPAAEPPPASEAAEPPPPAADDVVASGHLNSR